MANHDQAINTLLNNGLRQRQLENVLASNCVMDWFGRTFVGQQKVVQFYQNSNATYEHSMPNVVGSEAFEDRPYHNLTRQQPPENLKNITDTAAEQWFDCETHSPVNLKEGQRTPEHKLSPPHCPPAPCRYGIKFQPDSDEEDLEDDDLDLSGFTPFDSLIEVVAGKPPKSPDTKKLRLEEPQTDVTMVVEPAESKFSDLHYLEATGSVTINRAISSDESEKRDCKLFVSYRVNKEDPTVIQIALIVYKSNAKNPKTRRNLMAEFETKTAESITRSSNLPSSSRCRTVVKSQRKQETDVPQVATEPPKNSKPVKRPLISKTSLRF